MWANTNMAMCANMDTCTWKCCAWHSPSLHVQPEAGSKVFHIRWGEHLYECIGDHVIHGAVDKAHSALLHHPPDLVILHIDVLCLGMVLMVICEHDGGLIVRKHGDGGVEGAKDLWKKALKPEAFLHPVCRHDILTLCCGEWNNLLALRQPEHSAPVNEECVARCHH